MNNEIFVSTHFLDTDESEKKLATVAGAEELTPEERKNIANVWRGIVNTFQYNQQDLLKSSASLARVETEMAKIDNEEIASVKKEFVESIGGMEQEFSVTAENMFHFQLVSAAMNVFRDLGQAELQTTQDAFSDLLKEKLISGMGISQDPESRRKYASFLNHALYDENADLCQHIGGSHPEFALRSEIKKGASANTVKFSFTSDFTPAATKSTHPTLHPDYAKELEPNGISLKNYRPTKLENEDVRKFTPKYKLNDGNWVVEVTGMVRNHTTVLSEMHLAGRQLEKGVMQSGFKTGSIDDPLKKELSRSPTASSNNSMTSLFGRWGNSSTGSLNSPPTLARSSTTDSLTSDSRSQLSHSTSSDSLRSKYASTSATSEAPSLFDKDQGSISHEDLLRMSGESEQEIQKALEAQAQKNGEKLDSIDTYLETQETLIKATIKDHYRDHVSREGNPVMPPMVIAAKAVLKERINAELNEYKPILDSMQLEQKKDLISQTIQDVTLRNMEDATTSAVKEKSKGRYSNSVLPEPIKKPEPVMKTGKEIIDIAERGGSKKTR